MNIKDGINSAFQSIFSHKLRSLLTLTGIVIGVLAVVTMFSSVYAIKALIKKNMEGMAGIILLLFSPVQEILIWKQEKRAVKLGVLNKMFLL